MASSRTLYFAFFKIFHQYNDNVRQDITASFSMMDWMWPVDFSFPQAKTWFWWKTLVSI
jgi:chlorite dismutase